VNLALLLPSALLALAALVLPLMIHLSRRSEQKPTDFAALRWISAQLRPRRKLVFQEVLLLLLRLLLLITLAVFLAKPVSMQLSSTKHWVAVVPGTVLDAIKDQTNKKDEWRWLSPGFPDFKNAPNTADIPVSSLLRELDAQLPANATLTVVVPEELAGLDGERIRLSRKVDWKIVPGKMPSVTIHTPVQAFRLAIRYDQKQADSIRYFRAAHFVWQSELKANEKESLDIALIASPLKQDRTALICLAAGELPSNIRQWISQGGTAIISKEASAPELTSSVAVWRNEDGKTLVRIAPLGQGRVLQWQQALTPEAMPELLDASFPERLKSLLQAKPLAITRAFAKSQTPLSGARAGPEAPQSLQIWFALFIALLFLLERWLANSSRRWSAA
jgi:hypothetical protein